MAHRKALALAVPLSGVLLLWPSVVGAHPAPHGRGYYGGVVVRGYAPYYFTPFFGFGWGYPYGAYGYGPYGFAPYAYGPYGYGYGPPVLPSGSARLQVTPKDAVVYVDGYRAGRVDDFDGTFQRLNVEPGPHEVTLFLNGYRTTTERLYFAEGSTIKLRQSLEKLPLGEASVPPPKPAPRRRPREER